MLFYQLGIWIVLFVGIYRFQPKESTLKNRYYLPIAFLVKLTAGSFFLFVYSSIYGKGALSADAADYLREASILNDVARINFLDYLKLLTGIGENENLVHHYLGNTNHWEMQEYSLLNDAKNVIRFHSLIDFFSFGSDFIHTEVICALGLIPIYQIYRAVQKHTTINNSIIFWSIVFLPSALFWSSGILKEPFLMLGIGFLLRALLDSSLSSFHKYLYFSVGLICMLMFKPYVLLCTLVAGTFYFFLKHFFPTRPLFGATAFCFIGLIIFHLIPPFKSQFINSLSEKQFDFRNIGRGGTHLYDGEWLYFVPIEKSNTLIQIGGAYSPNREISAFKYRGKHDFEEKITLLPHQKFQLAYKGEGCASYIDCDLIDYSYWNLFINIPSALSIAILHPFLGDGGNWLKYLSLIEVWVSLFILIFLVTQIKKRNKSNDIRVISFLLFALSLFLLIGWTTPVIGAVARYRFPAQLALLIAALLYTQPSMFKKLW